MYLLALLCILLVVYAAGTRQEEGESPPLNPGMIPTSAPNLLLLDANSTYQPGLEYYSRRLIQGQFVTDPLRIPMDQASTTTVAEPLTFQLKSDRYPSFLKFRYVDQSNSELVNPAVCRLTSTSAWNKPEEGEEAPCYASAGEEGWKVVINGEWIPDSDLRIYMTVVAVWFPPHQVSIDTVSNTEETFAFTASWLFRLSFA